MPILKDEKVEAGKITKNDIVKGRTAAVVKIGTKFAEVRDADGKMILRAPLRQTVAIMRPTPTDEGDRGQEGGARGGEARVARSVDQQLAGQRRRPVCRRAGQVQRSRGRWLGSAELLGPVHRPGQGAGRAQHRQGSRTQDRALGRDQRIRADRRYFLQEELRS